MAGPVIFIRVSAREHELIARAAEAEQMGITNWVRATLRKRIGLPAQPERRWKPGRYGAQGGQTVIYVRSDQELHDAVYAAAARHPGIATDWIRKVVVDEARRRLSRRQRTN
jgi:predicted HicB family RNase H-like nuclease